MIIVFWQQGSEIVERRVENERQAATLIMIKRSKGIVADARRA